MKDNLHEYHRFLDEAGDTTFYGKGKIPILGNPGVSNTFILGMVHYEEQLPDIRTKINNLSKEIQISPYYIKVPSVLKRVNKGSFYFHAKDDLPELRKEFFDFILTLKCSFQVVVGRKNIARFERKHNGKQAEFYADLLSHLLKDNLNKYNGLVINTAERANSTAIINLEKVLEKAKNRFIKIFPNEKIHSKITFSVHKYKKEPLLSIADYFCWAVQRVFEKGETRFYEYLINRISFVEDLYETVIHEINNNYYTEANPLTENNKVSPHSP
jgi:hypothetical protein